MTEENFRDLTTLEYVVLGFISFEPQSGYSIISTLETGAYRWSASPGSIYPMLKRLEKRSLIVGELDVVHETRPRKVYTLTADGGELLDDWIRAPLRNTEMLEEREIVLLKFLFAEHRLSREEVLGWLDAYEQNTEDYDLARRRFYDLTMEQASPHQQLILEATMMELDMQREWIHKAQKRLRESDL